MCVCVCVCVRERECMCVCVRACVRVRVYMSFENPIGILTRSPRTARVGIVIVEPPSVCTLRSADTLALVRTETLFAKVTGSYYLREIRRATDTGHVHLAYVLRYAAPSYVGLVHVAKRLSRDVYAIYTFCACAPVFTRCMTRSSRLRVNVV